MKHTRVVAKAVLQGKDQRILLVRRSKTDTRRPLEWDFPGGIVEDGEDFTSAVVREIEEEIGFRVAKSDLQLAYTLTEMTEHGNCCWLFYIGKTDQTQVKLSFEHDRYQWVTLDEAIQSITYHRQLNALKHIHGNKLFDD